MMMKLYNYFRSTTSYRTRIAMNLKGLDYNYIAVDLAQDKQLESAFKSINPQGLVPVLEADDLLLYQSPAILEWLEETYPQVSSARRFKVDLTPYPNIVAIDKHCCTLKAFADAEPMKQPDAPTA